MVELHIIIEGGVHTDSVSVETANNAESLRQSLHTFFRRILKEEDVSIVIEPEGSNHNAARKFSHADMPKYLFVDSDCPPAEKHGWFNTLVNEVNPDKTIVIPQEKQPYVFFMVQEMEAWFLKQVDDCLPLWAENNGYSCKRPDERISEHSTIRNRDIEELKKPSEKLDFLMKVYFFKGDKPAKYRKLKTASELLDLLDTTKLVSKDEELQRFIAMAKSIR